MNILQEILAWSKDLPDWQNDAIERIFRKQNLDTNDIDDLYALLKAEHAIPDSKKRTAKKLSADQVSKLSPPGTLVSLLAMKNLVHVNAIANNQKIIFRPSGLTVIYGDNGSGKSGYSRVLKKACRARDQTELILPNINLPVGDTGNAEADFEISVNGEEKIVKWINGTPAPEILSTIAIFDHRCARAYLDSENDFSYVPYGYDIFDELVKVCDTLKKKTETEMIQNSPDVTFLSDLLGDTVVGNFIENLSNETEIAQVEALTTLTSAENAQHLQLEKSLQVGNPEEKAEQLRIRSRRISRLINSVIEKTTQVDDGKLAHLQKLDEDFLTSRTAAELAARKFNDTEKYLSGTGGDAWKELFEAARKFSKETYPGKQFPFIEKGSRCPLCQQPLEGGAECLRQFEHFVQQETEKTVKARYKDLSEAKQAFVTLNLFLGLDDEILGEIAQNDRKLGETCRKYQESLNDRYSKIIAAFSSHEWAEILPLPPNPTKDLKSLAISLDQEAATLEKVADTSNRQSLEKQFCELKARIQLSKREAAVLSAIKKMKLRSKLETCLSELNTKDISLKAHKIAKSVITENLEGALNAELRKLDVNTLKVTLTDRGVKGKTLYKLKLDLPRAPSPGSILSEGEQRAIAIASFLAEVGLSGGSGGIVFDDPVSSLDHRRREIVAQRLAQESIKRQVIIFTHDLYFLNVLVEEAKRTESKILTQSLIHTPQGFGVADDNLPFEGKNTSARIGFLRMQQQDIAALFKAGDDKNFREKTIRAYTFLRESWERAVEEVLFRNVVLRFRKSIQTNRLSGVTVENIDYKEVELNMSKCSNFAAHDRALISGVAVPNPKELLEDIEKLEAWRKRVDERSKKTDSDRKNK
jgi:energy-coupling factor transporter ATP-binding protein EcfA2